MHFYVPAPSFRRKLHFWRKLRRPLVAVNPGIKLADALHADADRLIEIRVVIRFALEDQEFAGREVDNVKIVRDRAFEIKGDFDAVRVYATEGEICGVLRDEFGEYVENIVL